MRVIESALVVTRHPNLTAYLKEIGLIDDTATVIEHASVDDIKGKDVVGILPHSLSCLTSSFTELPLRLPPELRGQELSIDDLRAYAGEPATYKVSLSAND